MTSQKITDFSQLELPDKVRVVLLDLDNTLYVYDPCNEAGVYAVSQQLDLEGILQEKDFAAAYAQAKKVVKDRIDGHGASHSRLLYFYELLHSLQHPHASKLATELEDLYWKTFKDAMSLVPGAETFLKYCKKQHISVIILTDLTTRIQFEKLSALGITAYISYVLTSEAVGVEKPDQAMFAAALEKTGSAKSEVIMIGDDTDKDIHGAQQFGIEAIQITHEKLSCEPPLRQSRCL